MTVAEQVYAVVNSLPEALAREVLTLVEGLREREGEPNSREWWAVQQTALANVWDNEEDKVWDDL